MTRRNSNSTVESIYYDMTHNQLSDSKLLNLGMKAISNCNFNDSDVKCLLNIRDIFVWKELLFKLKDSVCCSFDTKLVARTAVLFDLNLVEKFYDDVLGLYIYLENALSFSKEEADLLKNYLFIKNSMYLDREFASRVVSTDDSSKFIKYATNIDKHIYHEAYRNVRKIKRI